jgi:hypothetical protein
VSTEVNLLLFTVDENNWSMQQATHAFTTLYREGTIPPEAFVQ